MLIPSACSNGLMPNSNVLSKLIRPAAALCSGPFSSLNPFTQAALCFLACSDFADRDVKKRQSTSLETSVCNPYKKYFCLNCRYMLVQASGKKKLEVPMLVFFKLHEYHIIVLKNTLKGNILLLKLNVDKSMLFDVQFVFRTKN